MEEPTPGREKGGGKGKEESPGRRFLVRTRFLLAVSPATGRV